MEELTRLIGEMTRLIGEMTRADAAATPRPVVCTDRGQHKRTVLMLVRPNLRLAESWESPDPTAAPGSGTSRESSIFDCPRCKRHVVVSDSRWNALAGALREIDISMLG